MKAKCIRKWCGVNSHYNCGIDPFQAGDETDVVTFKRTEDGMMYIIKNKKQDSFETLYSYMEPYFNEYFELNIKSSNNKRKRKRKKILFLILLLISASVHSQSLMLSVPKPTVRHEMSKEHKWELITEKKNLLSYQKNDTIVDFCFEKRICNAIYLTIPKDKVESYINERETFWCWQFVELNTWLFDPKVFETPILVKMVTYGKFKFTLEFVYTN